MISVNGKFIYRLLFADMRIVKNSERMRVSTIEISVISYFSLPVTSQTW